MVLQYNWNNKDYGRKNRNQYTMTETEWKLWNLVLKSDKLWYRFLRQKLIWNYILDFYCHKLKLWIEIDDKSHNFKWDNDQIRTEYLQHIWIKLLRYTNHNIYNQLEWVIIDIEEKIKERIKELNR